MSHPFPVRSRDATSNMYFIDDLLQLVASDDADGLKLHVGAPPVVLLDGEQRPIEGPALTAEDTEHLLHGVATTRQIRDLREHGSVQFIYRFHGSTDFVVSARMESQGVGIDMH